MAMVAKPGSNIDVRMSESTPNTTTNEKPTARRDEERQDEPSNALFSSDWWIWELIGIIGSAAALIGLIVLLHSVNRKRQPMWGGQIHCIKTVCRKSPQVSLNSVISIISTVAKICVLIPVTKGLGQLKWVYFTEKDRVLADFETFESATRGLSGSAMLVWRLRARHFAVLGAVAMILSLAFEPFIQNLVHYYQQNDLDISQIAYITNASVYDTTDSTSQSVNYRFNTTRLNQNSLLSASECVLVPCVRTVDANVSVLQDFERILNSEFHTTIFSETLRASSEAYNLTETGDVTFISHPDFSISSNAYRALQNHGTTTFAGTVSSDPRNGGGYTYNNSAVLQAVSKDAADVSERAFIYGYTSGCGHDPSLLYDSVGCAVDRAARSITKSMRDSVWNSHPGSHGLIFLKFEDARLTKGVGYSTFTYVRITWYWLALPAVLWMLSVVILLGTAWKSKRAGITLWRTSPLAMVFMGLDRGLNEKVRATGMTENQLSNKANDLQVRLRIDNDKPRFVGAA